MRDLRAGACVPGMLEGTQRGSPLLPLLLVLSAGLLAGPSTWPLVRDLVDAVETVPDVASAAALRAVYERMKLAIEPSAAVGVALLLAGGRDALLGPGGAPPQGRALRVGVVLCGGNVDLADLARILALAHGEGAD